MVKSVVKTEELDHWRKLELDSTAWISVFETTDGLTDTVTSEVSFCEDMCAD